MIQAPANPLSLHPYKLQINSGVRYTITTFGGMVAGWFAAKGYLSSEQIISILNSEVVIGLITSLITAVIGVYMRRRGGMIAATDALPGVQAVITTNTEEGKALAKDAPSASVAMAGSKEAIEAVKPL